ncbi:MAG: 3-deoxy-7-phosphoheptulonate synthase [Proteobacteria bacterium]|nr:3-deoxy-7-phosphoheptulonate synthase [Pseudomonadota bacterium]
MRQKASHHNTLKQWSVDSWQRFPVKQQPEYTDPQHLAEVLKHLEAVRGCVHEEAISSLGERLCKIHKHGGLILHAGDCAERFQDATYEYSQAKVWHILCLASLLSHRSTKEVLCIGRLAGQFAKPRSQLYSLEDGLQLPTFRGDNIHEVSSSYQARQPDPDRLLLGYYLSQLMMTDVTAALCEWNDEQTPQREQTCVKIFGKDRASWSRYDLEQKRPSQLFCSHEGLLLSYEQCLTRLAHSTPPRHYNYSTHLLWLGERTRSLKEGHLEYFRGIHNPVAIKLSAQTQKNELKEYLKVLGNKPYPLTIITRLGKKHVASTLPWMIDMVKQARVPVLWSCDPMHGSTHRTTQGQKTRLITEMLEEFEESFLIHQKMKSTLSGIHLEITHQQVQECLKDHHELQNSSILKPYTSYCDPRLNFEQSFDFIDQLASYL